MPFVPALGLSHSLATGYVVSAQFGQGRRACIILQELGLSPKVRINMSFPGSGSVYSMTIKPSTRSARSHRRDLSVEALELRRPQRTSNLVAAHGRARVSREALFGGSPNDRPRLRVGS